MYKLLLAENSTFVTSGLKKIATEMIPDMGPYFATDYATMGSMLNEEPFNMLIIGFNIETTRQIKTIKDFAKRFPSMCIFLFTEFTDHLPTKQLYNAGVKCILNKNASMEILNHAMQEVYNGKVYIKP